LNSDGLWCVLNVHLLQGRVVVSHYSTYANVNSLRELSDRGYAADAVLLARFEYEVVS
jgi:hypothetical protein